MTLFAGTERWSNVSFAQILSGLRSRVPIQFSWLKFSWLHYNQENVDGGWVVFLSPGWALNMYGNILYGWRSGQMAVGVFVRACVPGMVNTALQTGFVLLGVCCKLRPSPEKIISKWIQYEKVILFLILHVTLFFGESRITLECMSINLIWDACMISSWMHLNIIALEM